MTAVGLLALLLGLQVTISDLAARRVSNGVLAVTLALVLSLQLSHNAAPVGLASCLAGGVLGLNIGKNVVVIGGGDTGTDCVATAICQGCKSVTQLEIMPKLPLSRGQDNPWPEWPKVQKTDYGQAEAAEMFGQDPRRYETSTKSLQGNEQGQVTGVHTVRVEWNQVDGRWIPVETPGSEQVLPADLVLLALGFAGPEAVLPEQLGLAQDERTNVKAELGDFRTNVKGVFAAGDMRRGQSLVVWAM